MSNEENILNSHSIEGAPTPYVPYPPTFTRTNDSHQAMALNFMPATNYVLAPHGSPIWEGSADELAALVRDARRFRRMEARYYDGVSGRPEVGSVRLERWDAVWQDWLTLTDKPLAEIADVLPEVEQLNSPSGPSRRS